MRPGAKNNCAGKARINLLDLDAEDEIDISSIGHCWLLNIEK
jgi:hypothetical protein